MVFLRVFAIEKFEYSIYNARIKYEWVATVLIVVIVMMDEGIRSKKSLSLGMPMASQVIIQREASN